MPPKQISGYTPDWYINLCYIEAGRPMYAALERSIREN